MFRLHPHFALVALMLGLLLPEARAASARAWQDRPAPVYTETAWNGVVIRYNRRAYSFAPRVKAWDAQAIAAARLEETPSPCHEGYADCEPVNVSFNLYPRQGSNIYEWAARHKPALLADAGDAVLGGRHALRLFAPTDGVGFDTLIYIVPVDANVLVVSSRGVPDIAAWLRFLRPHPTSLAVGQVAMTKPGSAWNLWTRATSGARVYERPRLYGGATLTILAVQPQAVMVRTTDGVSGWLRAPAATALTPKPALAAPRLQFEGATAARRPRQRHRPAGSPALHRADAHRARASGHQIAVAGRARRLGARAALRSGRQVPACLGDRLDALEL